MKAVIRIALLALLLPAAPATAQHTRPMHEREHSPLAQAPGRTHERRISPGEAANLVQRQTGGRVLAVRRLRSQGRDVYRVKVLIHQGEVRIYHVDAVTGTVR